MPPNIIWAEQSVSSLKEELGRRGLSKTGKKADLVARLDTDDSATVENPPPRDFVWADQTVSELKAELERRGLPNTGRKAALVARLDTDDSATVEDPPPPEVVWADQAVSELKAELERRGLPKTGRKAALVARLDAAGSGDSAARDLDPEPQPKRQKKNKERASPDPALDGLTAGELTEWKDRSRSGERRARPFVSAPDDGFKKKLQKVRKERMFMLDRTKTVDNGGAVSEIFDIAGSTGNIYQTTIGKTPKCTCMDARIRGQKCKHIYYALIVILKAPPHLCYQNAFLTDEIQDIFSNAPITRASDEHDGEQPAAEETHAGTRKAIEGDCPICVFEMSADEDLVWCKASCGQNFHAECFGQWRRSREYQPVTCVYCRSPWQEEGAPNPNKKPAPGSLASLKEAAPRIGSYRNIGHLPMYQQLGK